MKILLFGYGEMGCSGLEFLLEQLEDVAAVVTHRDDPAEKRWFRSLAERASAAGLPVMFGEESDMAAEVARLAPDLILSCYYRNMIPTRLLRQAPLGALNLHGSLLPRLRGRAPLNWALIEGEKETGVTLHHMVKEPDAGDIVGQRGWRIGPRDTAKTLFDRAVVEARLLFRELWPAIREGRAPRIPQDPAKATYRGRRRPEDGRIDWAQPTWRVDGLVRAVTDPFPGAFTSARGRRLMVWSGAPVAGAGEPGRLIQPDVVATGDGAYRIEHMTWTDGPAAVPVLKAGDRLGDPT